MSWSYNAVKTDRDRVRFLIGDTDLCDQLLQDEEIDVCIELEGNLFRAACTCARTIAAKFARGADESVGSVKINFSQRYKAYSELCAELTTRADLDGLDYFCGGVSISDKDTREEDDDRVIPKFDKDLHDNPNSSPESLRREE